MGSGVSAVDAMVIGCLGVERRAERLLSYLAFPNRSLQATVYAPDSGATMSPTECVLSLYRLFIDCVDSSLFLLSFSAITRLILLFSSVAIFFFYQRSQKGARTFMVKVKAHRGEPLNEKADTQVSEKLCSLMRS